MMRTCKTVLRCARKLLKQKNGFPRIYELAHKTGLPPQDVFDACKILTDQWYMEYLYPVEGGKASPLPDGVRLTLKGKHPVEYVRSQLVKYLKAHWISLLALLVSLAALAVSVLSALYPSVVKVILLS